MKSENSEKGIVKTIIYDCPCQQVSSIWPVLLMFFPNAGYMHLIGYFRLDLKELWLPAKQPKITCIDQDDK